MWFCLEMRREEQESKNPVTGANREDGKREPVLRVENDQRSPVGHFFKNGRRDQRAVPLRIFGNHQEHQLPRQPCSKKTIEIFRMGDGGRRLPPDGALHEIDRREDQKTINSRNQKYDLRESRIRPSAPSSLIPARKYDFDEARLFIASVLIYETAISSSSNP